MKLILTHAEVEAIVLSVVNNNYGLPVVMHVLEVGPDVDPTFTLVHVPARNGLRLPWWKQAAHTLTFNYFNRKHP